MRLKKNLESQPARSTGQSVPEKNSKVYMTVQKKMELFSDTQKGTKKVETRRSRLDAGMMSLDDPGEQKAVACRRD